jgi:hypothetical protein
MQVVSGGSGGLEACRRLATPRKRLSAGTGLSNRVHAFYTVSDALPGPVAGDRLPKNSLPSGIPFSPGVNWQAIPFFGPGALRCRRPHTEPANSSAY